MLGDRIRQIRQQQGTSLVQLSRKVGLTPSLISQVERDLVSPSINSLRKIARALDVPITAFFEEDGPQGTVVRAASRKKLLLPDSLVEYELLSPDQNRRVELLLTRLGVGGQTSEDAFGHDGEETVLVLGGQVKFYLGTEVHILNDGDSVWFEASVPHKMVNTGQTKVTLISAISPPSF
ncbi:MAG: XRE family transcriptional regulator [Bacillota bacterium]